ncbi:putative F-box protein At5g62660 [Lycium barbarum]|uniref:putative F-box protein At5g62660 n=1 Tax=Lycium barbarum TaxID=112863 RepID=UPI00293F0188|nr:putative F-box protein At5g62660 [Lycium barbarum]
MEKKVKEIPSEIAFQILGWLPVKSLNRFKCVSTSWSSMIFQHRPYDHIVVNVTLDNTRCAPRSGSMKAGLFCGPIRAPASSREQIQDLNVETFVQQLSLPYLCYENITPVVNGLACLYTGHQVSLFNMFTCEIMNLPSSSLHPESSKIWYALGFDPIDNVYKLFKVCAIPKPDQRTNYYEDDRGNKYDLVYEVLTLDTSSISEGKWREDIDKAYYCEFSNVSGQSYFVNGIIFWKFNGRIISFDVHQEKINIIEPPPC